MTKAKTKKTTNKDVEKAVAKAGQKLVKTVANKGKKATPKAKATGKEPPKKLGEWSIPVTLTETELADKGHEHARLASEIYQLEDEIDDIKDAAKKRVKDKQDRIDELHGEAKPLSSIVRKRCETKTVKCHKAIVLGVIVYTDPKTGKELHRHKPMKGEQIEAWGNGPPLIATLDKAAGDRLRADVAKTKATKLEWKGITPSDPNQLVSVGGAYQVRYESKSQGIGRPHRSVWIARHGQETIADADGTIEWKARGPAKAECQRHATANPPAKLGFESKPSKPNGKGKALTASIAQHKAAKADGKRQPRAGQSPLATKGGPRPTSDPDNGVPLTEL